MNHSVISLYEMTPWIAHKNMQTASHLQDCLNTSIENNDVSSVKSLARYHGELIDLNEWNTNGLCPLHQCCINGNKTLLSILLRAGADVNCVDPKGWTPLHTSSALGHYDFVVHLIECGANVMAKTSNRQLPIDLSVNVQIVLHLGTSMNKLGYGELANFYIKKLSELETSNMTAAEARVKRRRSFFQQSSKKARPHSILKHNRDSLLMRDGMTVRNSAMRNSFTIPDGCLSSSSSSAGSSEELHHLKNHSVQFSPESLLNEYVHCNEYERLEAMLESVDNSVVNKLDRKGLSPIHWAAIKGYPNCIRVLAKYGGDVDVRDPFGWTPLHAAVVSNHLSCIEELLKLNADVYALTVNGQSVFDWTSQQSTIDLLQKHVGENITDKELKSTDI